MHAYREAVKVAASSPVGVVREGNVARLQLSAGTKSWHHVVFGFDNVFHAVVPLPVYALIAVRPDALIHPRIGVVAHGVLAHVRLEIFEISRPVRDRRAQTAVPSVPVTLRRVGLRLTERHAAVSIANVLTHRRHAIREIRGLNVGPTGIDEVVGILREPSGAVLQLVALEVVVAINCPVRMSPRAIAQARPA